MTRSPPGRALLTAVTLFTVVPVPRSAHRRLDPTAAAAALRWLPGLGLLLGAVAALVVILADQATPGPAGRVLGAVLALAALAALTGGMHLDGLADTVDGLASRRPAEGALSVMARSDVGPIGVAALFFTVAVQVSALAAIPDIWLAAGAVVLAAVTARTAVLMATGPGVPSARPGGFGALVTGSTPRGVQAILVVATAGAVAAVAMVLGGPSAAPRLVGAYAVALLVADLLRRRVERRLGGMTGDVYGALVEVTTAVVLLAVAWSS